MAAALLPWLLLGLLSLSRARAFHNESAAAWHQRQLGDNACYNAPYYYKPTDWNETFVHQVPARIFLQHIWTPARRSNIELTLVTHLSISRLFQLEAQCAAWEGDFAAVVYLPIIQLEVHRWLDGPGREQVRSAKHELNELHSKLEARAGCRMTLVLVWEAMTSENVTLLYPYNQLRNTAIMQARTPLVAMLDVDLVPSPSLNEEMKDPGRMAQLKDICAKKAVVVLPAFVVQLPKDAPQPESEEARLEQEQELCAKSISGSKEQLHEMWRQGTLIQFAGTNFPRGHNSTRYPKWMTSNEYYKTSYMWEYEPWYIVDRRINWWYDVRFRAWFFDKALQLGSMAWRDQFDIYVHPRAFLVHRPHPKTSLVANEAVFSEILRWMKPRAGLAAIQMLDGTYKARIDHSLKRCVANLPWWQVPHHDSSWERYIVTVGEGIIPTWV